MPLRRLSFLALFACLAGAQTPPPPSPNEPEVSSRDASITFKSKVNEVLVPVVVRDRAGKPVDGLAREDFVVFDKGRQQTVTKVSIERAGGRAGAKPAPASADAGSPAAPPGAAAPDTTLTAPDRFTAFFFDDVHLETADLIRARQAVEARLSQGLDPRDRAGVYTTSGQTTVEFTDDLAALKDGLERVRPHPIARPTGQDCPDIGFYQADLIANKHDAAALGVATRETMICQNLPSVDAARTIAQGAASTVAAAGEHETRIALGTLEDLVRRMSAMPGQRLILLVSPGFLRLDSQLQDESEIMDRAIRANVTVSALDARGLYVDSVGVDKRTLSLDLTQAKQRYEREQARASSNVMAEFADATGGTLFENNNDLTAGVKALSTPPEVYYVVAFSPQNMKPDGSYHHLKVALRNRSGLSVKARQGYFAPRHAPNAEEEAKEEISEALFSREELRDIPVDLHTQYFMLNDDQANLDVIARVDVRKLHFRKVEGRNGDEMTVVSGLFDRNGNFLQAVSKSVSMKLKDETLAGRLNSGIAVHADFKVAPGRYLLRLVVRDSEGQSMAAQNGAVEIP